MTQWIPPLNQNGKPCQRCKPGRLCPMHRAENRAKPGPRYRLDRDVLADIARLAETSTRHEPLWTAAGVSPPRAGLVMG